MTAIDRIRLEVNAAASAGGRHLSGRLDLADLREVLDGASKWERVCADAVLWTRARKKRETED